MTAELFATDCTYHDSVRKVAGRSFADYMAATLAATRETVAKDFVRHTASGSSGGVPLPVGSDRVDAEKAALAWGFCAHYLDYDDISQSTISHPSAVLFSALIPVAYEQNRLGEQVLTAYLSGLDFMTRHGSPHADAIYANGWHTTSVLGVVGATRALATLTGMDPERTADAIGLASSLASGLRANFGSTTKPLHAGWAAASAVFAMRAVDAGIGASRDALVGAAGLLATAGKGHHGDAPVDLTADLVLKPYPSCGYSLRLIDAALALHRRVGDVEIQRVICTLSARADQVLRYPAPTTENEARFSAEYVVSCGLLEGRLGLMTFSRVNNADIPERVAALMTRVEREVDPSITSLAEERASVEAIARGGERWSEVVHFPLGHPRKVMPEAGLREKFEDCLAHRWTEDAVAERFDATRRIDSAQGMRAYVDALLHD